MAWLVELLALWFVLGLLPVLGGSGRAKLNSKVLPTVRSCGDGPLTIDLDSTICETYGLAKEGARRHGYTGQRGYHPTLAVAAGTGEVLLARLRQGRANTAPGARSAARW